MEEEEKEKKRVRWEQASEAVILREFVWKVSLHFFVVCKSASEIVSFSEREREKEREK